MDRLFLSYSSRDQAEASLLQFAAEQLLSAHSVQVWTFQRDQSASTPNVASALRERMRESCAVIFLLSPNTLDKGMAQWMELGYAHAFGVPVYIVLHRVSVEELQSAKPPPFVVGAQCTPSTSWRELIRQIEDYISSLPARRAA